MNSILNILGKIYTESVVDFYKELQEKIEKKEKTFIVTANPEIVMNARKDSELEDILLHKAIVTADGIGVAKAVQFLLKKPVERNPGIQTVEFLMEQMSKTGGKVFIYGSKQEVLDSFCELWPNTVFTGVYNGYDYKEEQIAGLVHKADADVILVALGSPRQELVINRFYDKLEHGICVGIGGSLDVLSGHVKRAPEFFIKNNLEWLYRISTQPKRILRFIKGNVYFVYVYYLERIKSKLFNKK